MKLDMRMILIAAAGVVAAVVGYEYYKFEKKKSDAALAAKQTPGSQFGPPAPLPPPEDFFSVLSQKFGL